MARVQKAKISLSALSGLAIVSCADLNQNVANSLSTGGDERAENWNNIAHHLRNIVAYLSRHCAVKMSRALGLLPLMRHNGAWRRTAWRGAGMAAWPCSGRLRWWTSD